MGAESSSQRRHGGPPDRSFGQRWLDLLVAGLLAVPLVGMGQVFHLARETRPFAFPGLWVLEQTVPGTVIRLLRHVLDPLPLRLEDLRYTAYTHLAQDSAAPLYLWSVLLAASLALLLSLPLAGIEGVLVRAAGRPRLARGLLLAGGLGGLALISAGGRAVRPGEVLLIAGVGAGAAWVTGSRGRGGRSLRIAVLLGVAGAAALLPLAGRSAPPPAPAWTPAPPSPLPAPGRVILIIVDTLRADHLSCYGYSRPTTPRLDRLAAEGVRFHRAYAPAPWTLPSCLSTMTSLHPPQHTVEDQERRIDPRVITLAEAFARQGWHTAAFVTHIFVSSLFGFETGFQEFKELSIEWNFQEGYQLRAEELNQFVFPWLAERGDDPFFLYLHYFDPHWDYDPPPPFRTRFTTPPPPDRTLGAWPSLKRFIPGDALLSPEELDQVVALYDGEIAYTDHHLGRLFDHLRALGLWEDTLLIVQSDHGEEFQDHRSMGHTRTLYEEVLRVPLILKPPGPRPAGVRPVVTERVRLLDVAPTALQAAGLATPPTFQGESLLPLLTAPGADRDLYARTVRHRVDQAGVIRDGWKLVHGYWPEWPGEMLFHLPTDPAEQRNLLRREPERAAALRTDLHRWLLESRRSRRILPHKPSRVVLTEAQKEHLRSLGYVD